MKRGLLEILTDFKMHAISIQAISVVYAYIAFHCNISKQFLYLSL